MDSFSVSSTVDSGVTALLTQTNSNLSISNAITVVILLAICVLIGIEIGKAFSFWKW